MSFINCQYHVYYDDLSIHVFGNINALMVQRRRFGAGIPMIVFAINPIAITMLSQKKLNTYGVESPCERLPRVGSFLANPGLSKAQLVPSCEMKQL